ncbi:hypothetical protein GmHk_10G029215 [Glycine max]|nr:hypothetical protein GmHk_10G029215 [Glycine max]
MQQHYYLSGGDHFPVHRNHWEVIKKQSFKRACLSSEKEKTQNVRRPKWTQKAAKELQRSNAEERSV